MENWSSVKEDNNTLNHYSITPVLQYSNTDSQGGQNGKFTGGWAAQSPQTSHHGT